MRGGTIVMGIGACLLLVGIVVPGGAYLLWPERTSGLERVLLEENVPVQPGTTIAGTYAVSEGRGVEVDIQGTILCRSFRRATNSNLDQWEPNPMLHGEVALTGPDGRILVQDDLIIGRSMCGSDQRLYVSASTREVDLHDCRFQRTLSALPRAQEVHLVLTLPETDARDGYLKDATMRVTEVPNPAENPFWNQVAMCCGCNAPVGLGLLILGFFLRRRSPAKPGPA